MKLLVARGRRTWYVCQRQSFHFPLQSARRSRHKLTERNDRRNLSRISAALRETMPSRVCCVRFALVAVLNFSSASSFALHNSCRFTSSSVSLRRKCGVLHAQLSRPSRRSVVLRLHRRFYIFSQERVFKAYM